MSIEQNIYIIVSNKEAAFKNLDDVFQMKSFKKDILENVSKEIPMKFYSNESVLPVLYHVIQEIVREADSKINVIVCSSLDLGKKFTFLNKKMNEYEIKELIDDESIINLRPKTAIDVAIDTESRKLDNGDEIQDKIHDNESYIDMSGVNLL